VRRGIEAWSSVHSRGEDGTSRPSSARARSTVVEISDAGAKDLGQRYWREAVRAAGARPAARSRWESSCACWDEVPSS
jgi:hypothetical protein